MEVVVRDYGVFLGYRRGALLIKRRDRSEAVPLAHVRRIWILTGGVAVSSKLVRAASRLFIDIVYFDGRGNPAARVFPPDGAGVVSHKRAQYEAYFTGRGFELAKRAVYGKLANQAAALRRIANSKRDLYRDLSSAASHIAELAVRVLACGDAQCVMGVEGAAASEYWRAVSSAYSTPPRSPEGEDPFNLALNYSYGVLRYAVWRQAVVHGLDPYAGYLHADKSGRPSLVLDLMEEFRPAVDLAVLRLGPRPEWLEGGVLKREARAALVEAWLSSKLEQAVAKQVGLAVRHLLGEGDYAPFRL